MNKCDEINIKIENNLAMNVSEERHISSCHECQQKQRLMKDMNALLNIGVRREKELFDELALRPHIKKSNKALIFFAAAAAACLVFFFMPKKYELMPHVVNSSPVPASVETIEADTSNTKDLRQLFSYESAYKQKKRQLMAHLSYRTKIKYKSKSLKSIHQRWHRKAKK